MKASGLAILGSYFFQVPIQLLTRIDYQREGGGGGKSDKNKKSSAQYIRWGWSLGLAHHPLSPQAVIQRVLVAWARRGRNRFRITCSQENNFSESLAPN